MIKEIEIGNKKFRLIVDYNSIIFRWGNKEIIKPEPMEVGDRFTARKFYKASPSLTDIHYFDNDYEHTDIELVKKFIENNRVSEKPYIKTKHDCENFAFKVWVDIQDEFGLIPLGVVKGYCSWLKGYHAWCIFFDNEWNMHMIEPQNDKWYPYTEDIKIVAIYI